MPVRRRPSPSRALLSASLAAACAGCIQVDLTFGRPVADDAALAALVPGRSARADALARLGPPDEFVKPYPAARFRSADPAAQRILDERDLFGRRAWTWTHEVRSDDVFVFVPFVPLFTWWRTEHLVDRVLVTFDAAGRVEHVAAGREVDA